MITWITRWIKFCIKYSRLLWVCLKETWRKFWSSIIRIYINKIENRITFKIKTRYLELLTPETIKLLGSTENKIRKNKNGENVPYVKVTEVVLVHCNIVDSGYQQDSQVLYTCVPNNAFGQLLEISPTNAIFLKTFNSEFSYIKVWFTDQNSRPLEIVDKINLAFVIKRYSWYKNMLFNWNLILNICERL